MGALHPSRLLRLMIVGAFTLLLLLPLAILFNYSLAETEALQHTLVGIQNKTGGSALLPSAYDITVYKKILTESRKFAVAFLNSIHYSTWTTIGQLLLALPAAIALSALKVPGRYFLIPLYLIIMMMPFQVTMVPSYLTLHYFNMLDSSWAIIVPLLFMPFSVIMLYLFMIQIPDELYEAAQVDGAGPLQLAWHIVIPLIRQGLWAIGLLHFVDTWNMIEQPIVFLSTIDLMPLSIMIRQSITANPALAFVPAILFVIPVAVLYIVYHRHIIGGMQMLFSRRKS